MKIKIEYIVLLILIAGFSVFLFVRNQNKTHYKLPEISKINEKDINKIIIKKTDGEITLVKENDKWLIGNEKFPSNKDKINNMIEEITGFSLTALVSESKNYDMYELDKDKKIELEVLSGDKILRKIDIGKPASSYRHTFVRLDKDDKVYQANRNFKNVFDNKISDLRDKLVMHFEENITELVLNDSKKEMKILKKTPGTAKADTTRQQDAGKAAAQVWLTDKNGKVKEREIEALINNLKNLNCDDFITDQTKDDFKKFIYKINLKGNKSYTISIYEKKDNRYIAVSSENNYPFYIQEWSAKNLIKELDSIVEKEEKKAKTGK